MSRVRGYCRTCGKGFLVSVTEQACAWGQFCKRSCAMKHYGDAWTPDKWPVGKKRAQPMTKQEMLNYVESLEMKRPLTQMVGKLPHGITS